MRPAVRHGLLVHRRLRRGHLWLACIVVPTAVLFASPTQPAVRAAEFASSVQSYTRGNVFIASGAPYDNAPAALAAPEPIVGASTAFAGILSPFNGPYEQSQIVVIGQGGQLTLEFANPVPVVGGRQVGVFTSASLLDSDFPNGSTVPVATTGAMAEYGAERSAIVEVASDPNDFPSLGRIVFDLPTNYYANAASPFQFPPPDPAVVADFDKPYTGTIEDLDNKTFDGVLAALGGSPGGTWLVVPDALGLSEIRYVRLSQPLWVLPDGSTATQRTSIYDPNYVKPADLFIDSVALVPEPATAGLLVIVVVTGAFRRHGN